MTNEELIKKAESVLNPHRTKDGRLHGDVGATLTSDKGNLYTGVCIDAASCGICAETGAIAAMVNNKEYKVQKIVAVWRDEKTDKLHILPPCGVCREFIRQIDETNLDTNIVLGKDKVEKLRDLLPHNDWPDPIE
jgi:cytidine deaminase